MPESLRPYYDRDTFDAGYSVIFKPGVGLVNTDSGKPITASVASKIATKAGNRKFFQSSNGGVGLSGFGSSNGSLALGSSGKNYVYDLEIQEYFDSNNITEVIKNLLWSFFTNYCKAVMSQPLEIVRLVLQVGYFSELDFENAPKETHPVAKPYARLLEDTSDSEYITEEVEEEIDYFQSTATMASNLESHDLWNQPKSKSVLAKPKPKRATTSQKKSDFKIHPTSKHTADILLAIVAKDGPFALFKGINASFIYQTLSHTIEAWITGFMSPFLGIPDPFFLDLTHLTDPWKSLWLSVSACILTGLILMPLDLVKVRLMLTQFNKPPKPQDDNSQSTLSNNSNVDDEDSQVSSNGLNIINRRSIRESIRNYPLSLLINPPSTITCLTVLYQFSSTIFRKAAPYILFIRFNVDSYLSPILYTMVNLLLLILEFFVKLPVENLLRKEQLRFLLKQKSVLEDEYKIVTIDNEEEDLIVEFNDGWKGKEDEGNEIGIFERIKRLGLFDGWRVGVLNVLAFWGYNIFKSNAIDFKEERL